MIKRGNQTPIILKLQAVWLTPQRRTSNSDAASVTTLSYLSSRVHKECGCLEGNKSFSLMDINSLPSDFCSPHPRGGQQTGSFSLLSRLGPRGMEWSLHSYVINPVDINQESRRIMSRLLHQIGPEEPVIHTYSASSREPLAYFQQAKSAISRHLF